MVAVDLSPHSEKTAAYAAKFARSLGASITLVHVFPPEPTTEFTSVRAHEVFEEGRWRMLGKLTKLMETVQQTGVECTDDFRVGDPAEEVVLAAQSVNADLIITASRNPGLFGRFFGLDQAPRILHRATCPVLVYHEETGERNSQ
jgi:nucleotide-binding universal stress UspA family protein